MKYMRLLIVLMLICVGGFLFTTSTQAASSRMAIGIFSGFGDPHSFEVIINGEAFELQIQDDSLFDVLKEGDKIVFSFQENDHGQYLLGKLLRKIPIS